MTRTRALALFLCGCAVMAVVVVVLQLLTKVSDTQDARAKKADTSYQTLDEVQKLSAAIRSCLDPDRPCAKRNQRATAQYLATTRVDNRQAAAAATYCATRYGPRPKYEQIYACINQTLLSSGGRAPSNTAPPR